MVTSFTRFIVALSFLRSGLGLQGTSVNLASMGMMMQPPTVLSLPATLLFFVMIDGWNLLIGSLSGRWPETPRAASEGWLGSHKLAGV